MKLHKFFYLKAYWLAKEQQYSDSNRKKSNNNAHKINIGTLVRRIIIMTINTTRGITMPTKTVLTVFIVQVQGANTTRQLSFGASACPGRQAS